MSFQITPYKPRSASLPDVGNFTPGAIAHKLIHGNFTNMPRRVSRRLNFGNGRRGRTRTRIMFRYKPRTFSGLTSEYDRTILYKKKYMPKKKKRRWKKFSKKVKAVADKSLGSRTCIFNKSFQKTNDTSGEQGRHSVCLYGWSSSDSDLTWNDDLVYLSNLESLLLTEDQSMRSDSRFLFKSGVLDITIRNTSTKTDDTSPTPVVSAADDMTLEVDMYEMTMKRECEVNGVTFPSISNIFEGTTLQTQDGIIDNNTGTPSANPINCRKRGATPFDCTVPLSTLGIKILKKTKWFIKGGETATYQYRDPRNWSAEKRKLNATTSAGVAGCNFPGRTRHFLILFKSVPGFDVGLSSNQNKYQERITVGVTRKYMYKVRGINNDASHYLSR
jgi:hypothetical protein